jgi:hypothetical protein
MGGLAATLAVLVAAAGCASAPGPSAAQPPAGTGLNTLAGTPHTVSVNCTGTDADAGRLQRAINASTPGTTVAIRGGVCLLTRPLSLPGDRSYTGGSTTGTVLRQAASMSYVLVSAAYLGNSRTTGDPLAISGLTVACDGSGGTDGIVLMNWQVNVAHVDVSHCGGSGIVDTSTSADGHTISNTSVNSRFTDNFISRSGRYGFEVADQATAVTDGYLTGNQIGYSGRAAINLQTASGWDISGNHLYGNTGNAISAGGLYGTTISGNYIEDYGAKQGSGTWYGISGTVQGGVGSTIYGNKLGNALGENPGARHVGIGLTQARGGTGFVAVTGNVIVGHQRGDISMEFNGNPSRLMIASSGNLVSGISPARRSGAVTLTSGR